MPKGRDGRADALHPALAVRECSFLFGVDGGGQLNIRPGGRRLIPGAMECDELDLSQGQATRAGSNARVRSWWQM